jgi:hypothetical protein
LTTVRKNHIGCLSFIEFNHLHLFEVLFAISLISVTPSAWVLASPSPPPMSYANTSRFAYAYGESICSFNPNLGCAVGLKNVSGLVVLDKQTQQIYKVQPFKDGLPLCSDPVYALGALGSSCYDNGDLSTPTSEPISPLLPPISPGLKSQ